MEKGKVETKFTTTPDEFGNGGEIQLKKYLSLRVGDCLQDRASNGSLRKRKIASFTWSDMENPVEQWVTECRSIEFDDGSRMMKGDFYKVLEKVDCSQLNAPSPTPNARKTRKPTKKVRRNRHANSRRN